MLVLKNRAVSPQRAQAREMNSEFNAVSVTFESRPILLLIILKKWKFYVQTVTTCSFAFLCKHAQNFAVPGSVIFQVLHFPVFVLFLVRHFQVLQIQWRAQKPLQLLVKSVAVSCSILHVHVKSSLCSVQYTNTCYCCRSVADSTEGLARCLARERSWRVCERGASTQAAAADGHHLPWCSSVSAGDARQNLRHETHLTVCCADIQSAVFDGKLGRYASLLVVNLFCQIL